MKFQDHGIDRVTLKYIAALAMLIDHIGMYFLPITTVIGCLCRIVGRLTFPIMCYFIAEGYVHTSSKRNYAKRLALFAFLSQFAYTFAHHKTLFTMAFFTDLNVLFVFLISFSVLVCSEKVKNRPLKILLILLLVAVSALCDWGVFAPILVLAFHHYRNDKNKQAVAFSVVAGTVVVTSSLFCVLNDAHWYGELWQLGLFLFLPFLYAYQGDGGSKKKFHKWFFYVFYPLHLLILGILARCL